MSRYLLLVFAWLSMTTLSGCITAMWAYTSALGPDRGYNKNLTDVTWVEYDNMMPDYSSRLLDADVSTFEILKESALPGAPDIRTHAKDRYKVWYYGHELPGADPATFELINSSHYSKDKNAVFYGATRVEGGDPGTVVVLEGKEYALDGGAVYYRGKVLEGVDPAGFYVKFLDRSASSYGPDADGTLYPVNATRLAIDGNRLFVEGKLLEGIDGPSVTGFSNDENFVRDKNDVFLLKVSRTNQATEGAMWVNGVFPLNACDPQTWRELPGRYLSRDDKCAYVMEMTLVGLDVDTWQYLRDTKRDSFFNSFVKGYHKDKNGIWFHIYKDPDFRFVSIDAADPASFEFLGNKQGVLYARDNTGCYRDAEKVDCSAMDSFSEPAE